jgi:hypothetical protein
MNNPCFAVGQVCNLSGQDAILSYDYLCNTIIRHSGVNKTGRGPFPFSPLTPVQEQAYGKSGLAAAI